MKALIIGTSNCLLNDGVKVAINDKFGAENVTNLSIGASSGTFLALFRIIEGIQFDDFDYIFFDSIVNEQWQLGSGRSPSFLWKIARILYGFLPRNVTYIYLGFCISPHFLKPNIVEHIHRSLCSEFEINFLPLRELLTEFAYKNNVPLDRIYETDDPAHFRLKLVQRIMNFILEDLSLFSPKKSDSCVNVNNFYIQDIRDQAPFVTKQATSLRQMEYGQFNDRSEIKLELGTFLGFDHCELETEAILQINGHRFLQKALYFKSDKPWMKYAAFNDELRTRTGSSIIVSSSSLQNFDVEHTDSTQEIGRPLTGNAKIGSLFYSALSIDEVLYRSGLDIALPPKNVMKYENRSFEIIEHYKKELLEIISQ